MDLDQAEGAGWSDPSWHSQGDWSEGSHGTPEVRLHDVNYMNLGSKGAGRGDSKGGKGPGDQDSAQYYSQIMMKATKGGSEGYSGN